MYKKTRFFGFYLYRILFTMDKVRQIPREKRLPYFYIVYKSFTGHQ